MWSTQHCGLRCALGLQTRSNRSHSTSVLRAGERGSERLHNLPRGDWGSRRAGAEARSSGS